MRPHMTNSAYTDKFESMKHIMSSFNLMAKHFTKSQKKVL